MNVSTAFRAPLEPVTGRRHSPLLTAATPTTAHRSTPVPSPAHNTPRAIRVRRSPR
ncbi:hypothetical protein SAMN05216489_05933 [Streptomyces sp. 3213]|nr:hypothetical protein SAMN05216489_05933 [Streptomyces sp. 3213] [Streptomyces sp. 3213.3]